VKEEEMKKQFIFALVFPLQSRKARTRKC